MLAQQEVAEELFKESRLSLYPFLHILIICPYKRIAEIPRVIGKHVILHIKAERAQIHYGKHSRGPRIPFSERMDLPKS